LVLNSKPIKGGLPYGLRGGFLAKIVEIIFLEDLGAGLEGV